jgi:glutaminyl-peptide cyclotransferase
MRKLRRISLFVVLIAGLMSTFSCNSCQSRREVTPTQSYSKVSPDFNADSAYHFIQTQVDFGPRIPGTAQHESCGDFLVAKLESYGATVFEQRANLTHYDGKNLPMRNIIGSWSPDVEKRILLFAHWDTRPFADEEIDPQRQKQPILGADDAASGVGVLLEIARQLQLQPLSIGVDIIFFDVEDWGQPSFEDDWVPGDWWCMGSQYWSEQPHVTNYKAYGILLDMVGGNNATFLREGYSLHYAPSVVEKIWSMAARLGYSHYFQPKSGGYITDDHVPVNKLQRAPSANIINLKTDSQTGFAPHWHTLNDDMRQIDRNTLKAVGQTVMEVIYTEK